ncbi:MAG: extracellular solute-binding protein [Candidatus Phytoplasma sp.]|nr:extracellular solute-binding protein [Phytoplasma sp.]
MKMKKIFSLLLLVVVTLSLAACRRVSAVVLDWNVISDDLEIDTSQNVRVIFWHTYGKENQNLLDEFIAEFKVLYPHIEIVHEQKGGYDEIRNAVNTALPAGNEPTMVTGYSDHVAGYINSGRVLPLNNLINNKNSEIAFTQAEIDDYITAFWDEGTVYDNAGTVLNLPYSKSTEAMFYNKTFFDKHNLTVPKTWDEVRSVSERIRTIIDADTTLTDDQKKEIIPFGYDSEANLFITAAEQKKIPYTSINEESLEGEILFNNDKAKSMVDYFNAMVQDKLFTTKALLAGAYTSTKFTEQKLYMTIGSTGGTNYNIPAGNAFEVGVASIPQFDLENQKVIQQGPNINMFLKDNVQENIAAWLFLKYITAPEQSARWSVSTGYSPVRNSSYETDTYKNYVNKENPTIKDKIFIDVFEVSRQQVDYYYTSPAFDRSSKARDQVGNLLYVVFSGQKSINDAFKDAYQETIR